MTLHRSNEYVCFQHAPTGAPMVLVAGHRHEPGDQGALIRKPSYYLFHYIESGQGTFALEQGPSVHVSAGDWFFAFPNQTISYSQSPEFQWCYYWIGFQGEGIDHVLAQAGITPDTGVRHRQPDSVAEDWIEKIIGSLQGNTPTSGVEAAIALQQLFCHLIWDTSERERSAAKMSLTGRTESIDKACQFMAEHYSEGIGVADVSDIVGFERTYFSNIFSQSTGITIREYLNRIRITRAQELLARSSLSVAEIAAYVGYKEARTFSHFFKHQTGLSPKLWRQTQGRFPN